MSKPAKRASTETGARKQTQPAATFEQALDRLEAIVEQLDDGELPLATSLELFKEGTKLAGLCREMLAQAERTVKDALDGDQGGTLDEEPGDPQEL